MRKFALATAAVMALAFSAPAFTAPALAQDGTVKVKIKTGDRGHHDGWRHRTMKKVVLHRDRGRHEGWRHHRHHGASKTVIIKKGHGKTIIKKKFEG